MKIAVLTSSRADYGIYFPLLKELSNDIYFEVDIIAFGTHLSPEYGETVKIILDDGFRVAARVDTMPNGDNPEDIALSMGKTIHHFVEIWNGSKYDLILALGDRYEMFSACVSIIPFGIKIAHIHGGETTAGAIDDVFRNSLTMMSTYHFTTTEVYKNKVISLKNSPDHVYNVGALSIDNLKNLELLSKEELRQQFGIDMDKPSILITFHPETVAFEKNEEYINQLIEALEEIKGYQFIITMPNADTKSHIIRENLKKFIKMTPQAIGIESFGAIGYLSCMKYCTMMLGNTSSGFVEASYFPKYVINLGKRQKGRIMTENMVNCKIEKQEIIMAVNNFTKVKMPAQVKIYGEGTAASQIAFILKNEFN